MSYISTIQTALRRVVNTHLATTVEYRLLTSGYGVEPRTYSVSWTSVGVVLTRQTNAQEWDEQRGAYVRAERIQIRTDDTVSLRQGDQFRLDSSDAEIWAVIDRQSGGPGSTLYICSRDIPTLVSGGDRHGGI
jgi:hypothetical protein